MAEAPPTPPPRPFLGRASLVGVRTALLLAFAAWWSWSGQGEISAGAIVPLALGALSNAILAGLGPRGSPDAEQRLTLGILLLDTALLTAVLAYSGGSGNPFTAIYLVPVLFGALTLPATASWSVWFLAAASYGALFAMAPASLHQHDERAMHLHLAGMYAGYLGTAGLGVYTVQRVRAHQRDLDARLAAARDLEARHARVGALATLAAGAAHELATPLSTILVIVNEWERRAATDRDRGDLTDLRAEVERCRDVLAQLTADSGEALGESAEPIGAVTLARDALRGVLGVDPRVEVRGDDAPAHVPPRLIAQVVRRLVGNACAASAPDAAVIVDARAQDGGLSLTVTDHGSGMDADTARRAGEPFFTTKAPGEGRGLGLYFVRSVVDRLGGSFTLDSAPQRGTTVHLTLPARSP